MTHCKQKKRIISLNLAQSYREMLRIERILAPFSSFSFLSLYLFLILSFSLSLSLSLSYFCFLFRAVL